MLSDFFICEDTFNLLNLIEKNSIGIAMLTKTKKQIRIDRSEWEKLRSNPSLNELIEFIEDREDLMKAKLVKGKGINLKDYLKKRGIQFNY
ncbi:MAG: hypothetical protein KKB77_08865 [Bacteroidetes bacterium]|nr:hypothetical protein [Bacteroidota bacterium]